MVLGYLNPRSLAGGTRAARRRDGRARVLDEQVARPLGLPLLEAAHGVYALASASMMRAVKAVST